MNIKMVKRYLQMYEGIFLYDKNMDTIANTIGVSNEELNGCIRLLDVFNEHLEELNLEYRADEVIVRNKNIIKKAYVIRKKISNKK